MKPDITEESSHPAELPMWQKLMWFIGLWVASVTVLAVIASLIRAAIL